MAAYVTDQSLISELNSMAAVPGGAVAPAAPTSPNALQEAINPGLIDALIQVESGGNNFAVSPKGATGAAQIMPATARDPGFGVAPVKDPTDPNEARRFATDYLGAMRNRYDGRMDLALMAYNWGPGNVDGWLSEGARPEAVPRETAQYLEKLMPVAQGGAGGAPGTTQQQPTGGEYVTDPDLIGFLDRQATGKDSGEFVKGLKSGASQLRSGNALEAIGIVTGLQDVADFGVKLSQDTEGEQRKNMPRVSGLEHVRTDSIGNFLQDVTDVGSFMFGQGVVSILPSLSTNVAARVITKHPVGRLATALPSYIQNLDDIHAGLKDELKDRLADGRVSRETAAEAAMWGAVPMAALDVAGIEALVGQAATKTLRRNIVKRMAIGAAKGAVAEGLTEGLQETISQWVQSHVGESDFATKDRFWSIVNNAFAGLLVGGGTGGAAGAIQQQQQAAPPVHGQVQEPPEPILPQAATAPQPQAGPVPQAPAAPLAIDPNTGIPLEPAETAQPPEPPPADISNPATIPWPTYAKMAKGLGASDHEIDVMQGLHRRAIEAALAAGQPVDPNVLADYPDIVVPPPVAPSPQEPAGAAEAPDPVSDAPESGTPTSAQPGQTVTPPTEAPPPVVTGTTAPEPSEGQVEAGNYKKKHIKWRGLDISIETEKGGVRRSKPGFSPAWEVDDFPADYGYVRRTEGADGEQVDVYWGGDERADRVFVIDQIDPKNGKFDEHKAMLGFPTRESALENYSKAFTDGSGPDRIGNVTEMSVDEFKAWARTGNTKGPAGTQRAPGQAEQQPEAPRVTEIQPGAPAKADDPKPSLDLAGRVRDALLAEGGLPVRRLQELAEKSFGGTLAEGKFDRKDMSDAMELGVNRFIKDNPTRFDPRDDFDRATKTAADLADLISRLPTQTVRSDEMEKFQQYSTPPHYAYAAAWVANIRPDDVVIEPSAGTGSLVAHALNAGSSEVIVNELSDRRLELLKSLGPDRAFQENAEQLNNILPKDVRPTVVLMNPPFSATAGRMGEKRVIEAGARHVEQALKRLQPGGRLVAIVGRGMSPEAPKFRDWWGKIAREYDVRANVGVSGDVFKKYGTTFDTRLLVIDKVPPAPDRATIVGTVDDVPALLDILNEVRDARPEASAAEQGSDQPGGAAPAAGGGTDAGPGRAPRPATPGVGLPTGDRDTGAAEQVQVRPGGKPDLADGADGKPRADDEVADVESERPGPRGTEGNATARPAGKPRPDRGGERPARVVRGQEGGDGPVLPPDGEPGAGVDGLNVESARAERPAGAITEAVFEEYKPQRVAIKGARSHPGELVQSAAMADVMPPAPDYQPKIPNKIVADGELSIAQLEAVIYAGQAHSRMLPAAEGEKKRRRGFFIGDGTGVGKGREISGIVLDNFNRGRTKAVWISERKKLFKDAKRDWGGLGQDPKQIFDLGKIKAGESVAASKGILFTTYDTLKSAERVGKDDKGATKKGKTRVDQIVEWLGPDFDGVIAFDESHNLGNAIQTKGKRGFKDASQKALAGMELQAKLPNARVVYVSATGATEVDNLAYADRLGLWGRGTPFASQHDFISQIQAGGIAAMELVARDMKAMGLYIARSLSFRGTEQERLEHILSDDQREIYDKLAEGWQVVLRNINEALEMTGANMNARAKSAAYSAFWGSHQRFFSQVITSMQTPSVLKAIERDLKDGRQAVLQLVNTNEASQERALANLEEEQDLEDLDMTPRDQLLQMIQASFPVHQYEEYMDDSGNIRTRPVKDGAGNFVENPEAAAIRDRLIEEVASIRVPDGPLEMILNHFGVDKVAEVTGRKRRVVYQTDERGRKAKAVETRSDSTNVVDADAFQAGKKPILVFSDAGGTGSSYHADNTTDSKGSRRAHYLLQAGWRADKAIQGFGRTHRTNQGSAPIYRLVSTDLKGQRRFISSIARRLSQLGALTKGSRQGADQGLFSARDNLESAEARDALRQYFKDLFLGHIPGMSIEELQEQTGLKLIDKETGQLFQNLPEITQFLNRLLSLKIDLQNQVFDDFYSRLNDIVEQRTAEGELDMGVEVVRAESIRKESEKVVYTDEATGAETKYVKLTRRDPLRASTFEDIAVGKAPGQDGKPPAFYVRSRAGRMYAVHEAKNKTTSDGNVVAQNRLVGPDGFHFIESAKLENRENWQRIADKEKAQKMWDEAVDKMPTYREEPIHLITGAVLPIWDRLAGKPKVYRLQTDEGERMLGRVVPDEQIAATLQNLGIAAEPVKIAADELASRIIDGGATARLANGWRLKRSIVAGEPRIEIVGPDYRHSRELTADGAFSEKIQYQTRYFVPTGDNAAGVLGRIVKSRPVVEVLAKPKNVAERRGAAGEARTGRSLNAFNTILKIHEIMGRMAPKSNFEIVEELFGKDAIGANDVEIGGTYDTARDLVTVSLFYGDPVHTVRHEVIHALRPLFTTEEWAVLERKARNEWRARFNIDGRYPDIGPTARNEEAVAEAFGSFQKGEKHPPGIRRLFDRIRLFLARLANALRGMGYQTAEDIFGRVESGEVGKRPRKGDAYVAGVKYSRPEAAPATNVHLESARRKIGAAPDNRTVKQKIQDAIENRVMDRFKQGVFDDLHGIKLLEEVANSGKLHEDARSAYKLARISRGSDDVIFQSLYFGAPVWQDGATAIDTSIKAPMAILEELGDRADDFEIYAAMRRARELKDQGRENLFTDAEIQAGLDLAKGNKDFVEKFAALQTYNKALLDFAQQSGLLDESTRALFEQMHQNYIPFFRVMENDGKVETKGPSARIGFQGQHPNFHRLKGGTENIDRPFLNMERNIHRLVEASIKNVVMLRTQRLNEQTGNLFMEPRAKGVQRAFVTNAQMVRDLKNQGIEIVGEDQIPSDSIRVLWALGNAPKGDNIVSMVRNGKVEFYEVSDPLLFRSLTMVSRMNHPLFDAVLKPFRLTKRLLTLAVGSDPSFQAANFARDTVHAAVISHVGFKPVIDSAKGLRHRLMNDPLWHDYLSAGGGIVSVFESDRAQTRRKLEKKDSRTVKVIDTAEKAAQAYERVLSSLEYSTRVGAYKKLRKDGKSRLESIYQARDISTDFAMRGDAGLVRFFVEVVPFLNAGLQGLYRTGRGFRENPTRFLLKGSIIAFASLALMMRNWDDDRYKELTDDQKDNYWHFWAGDMHYKIPKPFEVGAIFGTIPERVYGLAIERDGKKFWQRLKWVWGEMFRLDVVPQLAKPPLRIYANWDEFRERPVVPPGLERRRPQEQYDTSTPTVAVETGRLLGVSPKHVETIVYGYLGAIGGYIMAAADTAMHAMGGYPTKEETFWYERPVLRRFIGDKVAKSTLYVNDFYKMKKEVDQAYASMMAMAAMGETERVAEIVRDERGKISLHDATRRISDQLAAINAAMRAIQGSKVLTAEEKREQMDRLRQAKAVVAKSAAALKPIYEGRTGKEN